MQLFLSFYSLIRRQFVKLVDIQLNLATLAIFFILTSFNNTQGHFGILCDTFEKFMFINEKKVYKKSLKKLFHISDVHAQKT